jgi:hypothetical protein
VRAWSFARQELGELMSDDMLFQSSQDRFGFLVLKPHLLDPFTQTINRQDRHGER